MPHLQTGLVRQENQLALPTVYGTRPSQSSLDKQLSLWLELGQPQNGQPFPSHFSPE